MVKPVFEFKATNLFLSVWNKVFSDSIAPNHDTYTIYLTVVLDGYPISCCEIVELDPENYLIQNIAVLPEIRHKMIAQYTLRFAETKIREIGGLNSVIKIEPNYENHYYKLGFRESNSGEMIEELSLQKIEMRRVLRAKKSYKRHG